MGATTALWAAGLFFGGQAVTQKGVFAPPKVPKPPKPIDPEEQRKKELAALNKKKLQLQGAYGSTDTIKAGNIGPPGSPYKGTKTILGA